MNSFDTNFSRQNLPTFRLPWATVHYLELATSLGLKKLAANLIEVGLNADDPKFLCGILCFLKQPEVIKMCRLWGTQDAEFSDLARLGEAILLSPVVYKDLGGIDYSNPVSSIYYGHVKDCYLTTSLACPLPKSDPDGEPTQQIDPRWVQAFRLWTLHLALVANDSGIPSETTLHKVCNEIRLMCVGANSAYKRGLFRNLASSEIAQSLNAFQLRLQQKATEYLSEVARDPTKSIDGNFTALVKNDFTALFIRKFVPRPVPDDKDYGAYRFTPDIRTSSHQVEDRWIDEVDDNTLDIEEVLQKKVAGLDHVRATRANPDSTPDAQEQEHAQVLLLSREDALFLPWSWHRLSPSEETELFRLIVALKSEKNHTANLAAAIATVAILTGQSGIQVDKVEISSQLGDGWALHPQNFSLSRRPPRKANGWTPRDLAPSQVAKWLVQTADQWTIVLDPSAAQAFARAIAKVTGAKNLGELWKVTREQATFADWFNSRLANTAGLTRLTAPVLATVSRQEAFQQSQDHVLARVITSSPATALPSASAYGAYSGSTVTKAFTPVLTTLAAEISTAFLHLNSAGSQLEVLEEHLKDQLRQLEHRIESASSQPLDWVEYHNLLVTYVVLALLAVTGARPVNSPFESLSWFDFDRRLIFIDDKAGGMARASRLCILDDTVINLLQNRYLPHMRNLAEGLRQEAPEFAAQVDAVLACDSSANLPLFFHLNNEPTLDWFEVTETGLALACGVNEWPIPLNFLRHRFSTRLRKLHLDVEIIEALMGHGEAGCETHGAYSLRVLKDDLEIARPLVEKITKELQLIWPAEQRIDCRNLNPPQSAGLFNYTRKFGNKARAQQRRSGHERIKQGALADINRALDGRNPKTLSAEDWDVIGLKMVVNESSRLPQAFGALRYDVFQQYLRTIWKEFGIKPKVKRRFLLNREGTPTITGKSIAAPKLVAQLCEQFEMACEDLEKTSLGPVTACMLAALEACLNSNIADPTILISIACHSNVVPEYFDGKTYLEHHVSKDWKDGEPARRFPVTHRCIRHLLTGIGEQRTRQKLAPCLAKLSALPNLLGLPADIEFGKLLKAIASLVAQVNCYNFSGLQAAILDGRVHVSALPRHDWIRALKLERPLLEDLATEVQAITVKDELLLTSATTKKETTNGKSNVDVAKACRNLFKAIRSAISSKAAVSDKCTEIQKLLNSSIFEPGDLVYALGEWAAHNLVRPANTKTQKLKESSVETYFNELAGKVAAVAAHQQLSECDDEELLEIYRSLLQPPDAAPLSSRELSAIHAQGINDIEVGSDLKDAPEDEPQKVDGSVVQQLLDFHEWAAPKYGLEDPDFSELGEFEFTPAGRPGYVLKSEYLWCLRKLTSAQSLRDVTQENLAAAMVMIQAYRCGLRSREAMGCYRSDWVDVADTLVVLVQPNYLRSLKNLQSKRQVPRLEPFTPLEQKIEAEVCRRWEAREGKNQNTPLLAELNRINFKHFCVCIRAKLLKLLKLATGNPRATVHHLRHSFSNRALASIAGYEFELGTQAASQARTSNLRRLLLCNDALDRRAIWAICRLMGHSSPATLLKAYVHGQVLPTPQKDAGSELSVSELNDPFLVNLDKIERVADYLPAVATSNATETVDLPFAQTLSARINYMRLRGIGFPVHRAAYVAEVPILVAHHLETSASAVARSLSPMHKDDAKMENLEDLVRKVAASRWKSLLALSKVRDKEILLSGEVDLATAETVASHRHLVLFREEHLRAFSAFCRELDLRPNEIRLLRTVRMNHELQDLHKELGLHVFSQNYAVNKANATRISNVIAPHSSENQQQVKFMERWGVFCEPGKRFSDNFELMLLWMGWASRAATKLH